MPRNILPFYRNCSSLVSSRRDLQDDGLAQFRCWCTNLTAEEVGEAKTSRPWSSFREKQSEKSCSGAELHLPLKDVRRVVRAKVTSQVAFGTVCTSLGP